MMSRRQADFIPIYQERLLESGTFPEIIFYGLIPPETGAPHPSSRDPAWPEAQTRLYVGLNSHEQKRNIARKFPDAFRLDQTQTDCQASTRDCALNSGDPRGIERLKPGAHAYPGSCQRTLTTRVAASQAIEARRRVTGHQAMARSSFDASSKGQRPWPHPCVSPTWRRHKRR